jgi:hypothetical protein
MKPVSIASVCLAGLLSCVSAGAQDNPQPKPDAFERCVHAMSYDRRSSYQLCKEYLEKYPKDDSERVQSVTRWIAAYDHALDYAKRLSSFSASSGHDWFLYEPDISVEIPEVVQQEGPFKIEIKYSYNSPLEASLLKKAEAVYGKQDNFISMIRQDPAGWAPDLPAKVVPLWGSRGNDNVQVAQVITASSLRYYYDLSMAMREKRKFHEVFQMQTTGLKYSASIKHFENYEHAGTKFHDVYVADLNLEWSSICGGLCGIGFTRNKLVVFDNNGELLELFLDAPINRGMWVS